MARGHVDSADGLAIPNRITDYRGRRVAVAQQRLESCQRQHLGSRQREFASEEARVVTKNYERLAAFNRPTRSRQFCLQVKRDALRRKSNVIEREIARDQAAPPGSPELDDWRLRIHGLKNSAHRLVSSSSQTPSF